MKTHKDWNVQIPQFDIFFEQYSTYKHIFNFTLIFSSHLPFRFISCISIMLPREVTIVVVGLLELFSTKNVTISYIYQWQHSLLLTVINQLNNLKYIN